MTILFCYLAIGALLGVIVVELCRARGGGELVRSAFAVVALSALLWPYLVVTSVRDALRAKP